MVNILEKKFIVSLNENEFNEILNKKNKSDFFIINIDWKKIYTALELYKLFWDIIGFPDYFWNNWNAFWDVMRDDYFITKDIIISIKNIDNLLNEDYEDKKIFLKDLIDLLSVPYLDKKIQVFIIN